MIKEFFFAKICYIKYNIIVLYKSNICVSLIYYCSEVIQLVFILQL